MAEVVRSAPAIEDGLTEEPAAGQRRRCCRVSASPLERGDMLSSGDHGRFSVGGGRRRASGPVRDQRHDRGAGVVGHLKRLISVVADERASPASAEDAWLHRARARPHSRRRWHRAPAAQRSRLPASASRVHRRREDAYSDGPSLGWSAGPRFSNRAFSFSTEFAVQALPRGVGTLRRLSSRAVAWALNPARSSSSRSGRTDSANFLALAWRTATPFRDPTSR